MEKLYCGNCGYLNSAENKFCNNCGGKLINNGTSNIDIKSKKIKYVKHEKPLEETLTDNYQTLGQKLTLLLKTSGYFTMYSSNCYIQFLKYETENKLYVAIIHIDNTEKKIWNELESLKFEQVEENLIRSFEIVSTQKTIKEVIAVTKKIFERIYMIDPVEPFFYEILEEEKIDKSYTALKEKLDKQKVDNNYKRVNEKLEKQKVDINYKAIKEKLEKQKVDNNYKAVEQNTTKPYNFRRLVIIIVVAIIVSFFLRYINTSNNSNNNYQESTQKQSLSNMEGIAFVISHEFVKQNLKSPHTAVFPLLDFTCQTNDADSSFKVASYVDSQNAFGASIRTKYIVLLKYTGGDEDDVKNWRLDNISLFNENGESIN